MPDSECRERIIILETHMQDMKDKFTAHREEENLYLAKHGELLSEIRREQMKMKGFVSGVVFAISAIVTMISVFLSKMFGESG